MKYTVMLMMATSILTAEFVQGESLVCGLLCFVGIALLFALEFLNQVAKELNK